MSTARRRPRTPDERAEAVIADVLASDVDDQQRVVSDRRAKLALQRDFRPRRATAMIIAEAELAAAERYLVLLLDRQAAWRRDRTFERDLVERVLLLARIVDLRDTGARALRSTREGIRAAGSGTVWPADGEQESVADAEVSTVTVVRDYLRTRHPPLR